MVAFFYNFKINNIYMSNLLEKQKKEFFETF